MASWAAGSGYTGRLGSIMFKGQPANLYLNNEMQIFIDAGDRLDVW